MPEFVLKLQDIGDSGKDYAFRVATDWLVQTLEGVEVWADPSARVGSLEVRAERSGADVLVQGTLQTRVLTQCSRCLGDAPVEVDTRISSLMTSAPPAIAEGEEVELTEEDLDRDWFSGDDIVLDDIVRQHILLECPMQPLCATDCPGIDIPEHLAPPAGPTTDDGHAVDPRLAPLMAIKRELDDEDD